MAHKLRQDCNVWLLIKHYAAVGVYSLVVFTLSAADLFSWSAVCSNTATSSSVMWVLTRKSWKLSFLLRWEVPFRDKTLSPFSYALHMHVHFLFYIPIKKKTDVQKQSHHEEHCNFLGVNWRCWVEGFSFHHFGYNTIQQLCFLQPNDCKNRANLSPKPDINLLMLQHAFSTFLLARQ